MCRPVCVAVAAGAGLTAVYAHKRRRNLDKVLTLWRESGEVVQSVTRKLGQDFIQKSYTHPLVVNLALLQMGQQAAAQKLPRTVTAEQASSTVVATALEHERLVEALKYMRYATAAYGSALMAAFGVEGLPSPGSVSFQDGNAVDCAAVCAHCVLEQPDLVLSELAAVPLDIAGNAECPRYFIAIDRPGKAVVLAVRGTASISDAIVHDLVCVAKPFCGGVAHAGIARAAQAVHSAAIPTLARLVKENPGYNVVITGHSLGAGTAALLTLLLHAERDGKNLLPRCTTVRCFAFAPPPVFAPLAAAPPGALDAITAYVHETDCVPFLSLANAQQMLARLTAIDRLPLSLRSRGEIILGWQPVPPELVDVAVATHSGLKEEFKEVKTEAALTIPTTAVVWMARGGPDCRYMAAAREPDVLTGGGIQLAHTMATDHLFGKYESALNDIAATSSSA